jgi:cytochrome b561
MTWADRVATLMHRALYAAVLVMAGSGIAMAVAFDLPAVVFGGQGGMPPDFHASAARSVHGLASKLLGVFILLHVGAALVHQFVKRDARIARMGFGSRRGS